MVPIIHLDTPIGQALQGATEDINPVFQYLDPAYPFKPGRYQYIGSLLVAIVKLGNDLLYLWKLKGILKKELQKMVKCTPEAR